MAHSLPYPTARLPRRSFPAPFPQHRGGVDPEDDSENESEDHGQENQSEDGPDPQGNEGPGGATRNQPPDEREQESVGPPQSGHNADLEQDIVQSIDDGSLVSSALALLLDTSHDILNFASEWVHSPKAAAFVCRSARIFSRSLTFNFF